MTDLNDLDDIFGGDFEDDLDLEQASVTVDDFEEELFEDEEDGGLNRAFLFAGVSLFGTFAAIVAAIVLLSGGSEDSDAIATAGFIETQNALAFTEVAETGVAIENAGATSIADTATAAANTTSTAVAQATGTQDSANTAVAQTATRISVAATLNQFATETAIAEQLTANAPTAIPTVSFRFEIRDANGNPVSGGSQIQVFRDDGDREFNPAVTPTVQPTSTPTLGPTQTPEPDVPVGPTGDPAVEQTQLALTVEAQLSEFDRLATQRAEAEANATPEPTVEPTPETETETEATPEPTTVAEANDTEPVFTGETVPVNGGDGTLSLNIPDSWIFDDDLGGERDDLIIGESSEAVLSRLDGDIGAPTIVGTGGGISLQTTTNQVDELDLTVLVEAFNGTIPEAGGEFVQELQPFETTNAALGRIGIVRFPEEQGYIVLLGFDNAIALVFISAPINEFAARQAEFLAIIDSIQVPAAVTSRAPVTGDVVLMSFRPAAGSGLFQGDGGTPTPGDGGDEPGVPILIQPDGTGTITLPGEPGTYFLVLEFPPGTYTLFIEGQEIEFEVIEGQFTEAVVILADRTLIIRSFGLSPDIPTPTVVSPTPTEAIPLQDTPISPFLQTATAAARTIVPRITETVVVTITPADATGTPDAIPQTGIRFDDTGSPEGLTMLALMGIGLLGVVMVVRRLRSNIAA